MVSKASEDLPEPERPVNTTSWSRGISTSMFLRLCSRAPRIAMTRESGRRGCRSVSGGERAQPAEPEIDPSHDRRDALANIDGEGWGYRRNLQVGEIGPAGTEIHVVDFREDRPIGCEEIFGPAAHSPSAAVNLGEAFNKSRRQIRFDLPLRDPGAAAFHVKEEVGLECIANAPSGSLVRPDSGLIKIPKRQVAGLQVGPIELSLGAKDP